MCLLYGLPRPLRLLGYIHHKEMFKKMVKQHVMDHWEQKLRKVAADLPSLKYFKPEYLSLASPHPILSSAGSSPYAVIMANVQCTMLSGRYRTEALASHWSESGTRSCKTPFCKNHHIEEDHHHILAVCGSLQTSRSRLQTFTQKYCAGINNQEIKELITKYCSPYQPLFCQFLEDCSVLPEVIAVGQVLGEKLVHHHLFWVSRTWCYTLHRDRLKILGRWRK